MTLRRKPCGILRIISSPLLFITCTNLHRNTCITVTRRIIILSHIHTPATCHRHNLGDIPMPLLNNRCIHPAQTRKSRIHPKKLKSKNDAVANVPYPVVPTASSRVDFAYHTELSARRAHILDARKTSKREDCAAPMDPLESVVNLRDVLRWLCRVGDA
jgi:hypothetical protein